jgi:hypothetical protein
MVRTILAAVALVLFTVFIGGILASRNRPSPPPVPRPASPAAPASQQVAPQAMQVDAVKLWRDYDANEVSADATYKGRALDVAGVVAAIEKDAFGNLILGLRAPNPYMSTRATMRASEYAAMARLSKGARVTVRCIGAGKMIGIPILEECTFRSVPAPAP